MRRVPLYSAPTVGNRRDRPADVDVETVSAMMAETRCKVTYENRKSAAVSEFAATSVKVTILPDPSVMIDELVPDNID